MSAQQTSSSVAGLSPDEAAAFWLVQIEAERMEGRTAADFTHWLEASPHHGEAFERARGTWDLFDRAEGDATLAAIRVSALRTAPPRRRFRHAWAAGIAATLAGLVLLTVTHVPGWHTARPTLAAAAEYEDSDFATARGEQRRIELADGSQITLNTDSALRVAYSDEWRLVTLLRGQALFKVAGNRDWPFVVMAGNRQITALGTLFDVRLETDRVQVMLAEGKVVVDGRTDGSAEPRKGVGGAGIGSPVVPIVLSPGQELVARNGQASVTAKVDVEQQLRWREGFAEFEEVPLADAVAEMNRYAASPIVVDAAAGRLKVSGIFRTGSSPRRFAAILAEMLPVRARTLADGTIEIVNDGDTPI
ncbi:FecR family protein [Novosphingobium sp. M1R2S20]|uniref:FecR domain-containing protein n=1 Tax=Novosphingobium rhizovicinum TaxID=3228928 RepID=A0ABV3RFX4_9SPHN